MDVNNLKVLREDFKVFSPLFGKNLDYLNLPVHSYALPTSRMDRSDYRLVPSRSWKVLDYSCLRTVVLFNEF